MRPLRSPMEPPTAVFALMRLVVYPPLFLLGAPLNMAWNVGTFVYDRPRYSLRRHLVAGLVRFLGTYMPIWSVYPKDKWADKIPPSFVKRYGHLGEVALRLIPGISSDFPRLPILFPGDGKVSTAIIPGFMIAPKGTPEDQLWVKAQPGEKICLSIIGGGYQAGHPLAMRPHWDLAKDLRVFLPNYRKALDDTSAFPAQLLDALAGWQYLTEELGFEAQNIILHGPSAGGHLVIQLLRYLDELQQTGEGRGMPCAAFISAPWCDVTCSFASHRINGGKDWLQPVSLIVAPSYTRHYRDALHDPYLSPALTRNDGLWRRLNEAGVYVHVDAGTDEVLWDEINMLARTMEADGLDPHFVKVDGGTHCEYLFDSLPFKMWPDAGFSWPKIDSAWQSLLRAVDVTPAPRVKKDNM